MGQNKLNSGGQVTAYWVCSEGEGSCTVILILASKSSIRNLQYSTSLWSLGFTDFHFPEQKIAYASAAYLQGQNKRE